MISSSEGQADAGESPPLRCVNHRTVETYLRCGKCGQPICARCVVITPVGARCYACARPRKLPTFEVTPLHYLRAVAAALGSGVVAGGLVGFVGIAVPFGGLLLLLAIGYAVGESVSRAVNRKRGRALKAIAAAGVLVAVVAEQLAAIAIRAPLTLTLVGVAQISAASLLGLLASPFALIAVALGIFIAASRL